MCVDFLEYFSSFEQRKAKKQGLFNIRGQFGGKYDGYYERFEKAWKTKKVFSFLLPEPAHRIREVVEEVFDTDPGAGITLILNLGKPAHPAYSPMVDKNRIRIESD